MTDAPPVAVRRTGWFLVLGSLCASCVLTRVVLAFAALPADAGADRMAFVRPLFYALAGFALTASVLWSRWKLPDDGDETMDESGATAPLAPERFFTMSLVAMALAELSAVLGFVLVLVTRAPANESVGFAAGGFLVLVLVILPRGLKYWPAAAARAASAR
jgi:hypothetical protein